MRLNLKIARIKKGLSQEELSKMIDISRTTYRNIESGKTEPKRNVMEKLSEALDTPIMDLFFNE
ncbi:helix-turn-helix transcriptional regulator [Clostridium sp. 1001270J_160509_D11]|jgi:putative transcriptional regulator|uniref:helix-turn-helix transcriptional regulator n=1 Tax=Clostridium sp. 1001270J_160509_D11 TaxID=2787103 RepID=UPI0018AA0616|nr:helix-turn-helix transcriptional regulator [Clostridium sp. 1001270J_160509_D11]